MNKLRRELVDQLQRGERQRRGAIALGLGQPIDNAFGAEQFQPLEGERRASTVPQQPLQAVAILRAVYAVIVQDELVVRPLYYSYIPPSPILLSERYPGGTRQTRVPFWTVARPTRVQ